MNLIDPHPSDYTHVFGRCINGKGMLCCFEGIEMKLCMIMWLQLPLLLLLQSRWFHSVSSQYLNVQAVVNCHGAAMTTFKYVTLIEFFKNSRNKAAELLD